MSSTSSSVRIACARAGSALVALLLFLAFSTVFGFYLIWNVGGWAMDRLVYENKTFDIQEIDVQTDGVISTDQLRLWAGVRHGENLLALDLARVKRDLEMVSLIRSVAVERVLPSTLRLRISEREPMAQLLAVEPDRLPTANMMSRRCISMRMAASWRCLEPGQRSSPPTGYKRYSSDCLRHRVPIRPRRGDRSRISRRSFPLPEADWHGVRGFRKWPRLWTCGRSMCRRRTS